MIKPSVLFVLILCIAGYIFAQGFHKTHYQLKRSNGYHTFLISAAIGLFLFAVATFVYMFGMVTTEWVDWRISIGSYVLLDVFQSDISASEVVLFDVSIIALFLSWILPWLFYLPKGRKFSAFLYEFSEDAESPEFTQLLFQSHMHGLPILFTMSDRKIYIGYIYKINTKNFNIINILPYFSGYRDKDTLELHKVTPYHSVIEDIENSGENEVDFERFTIALPLREIVHAHLHDFRYEGHFKEKEEEHKTPNYYL